MQYKLAAKGLSRLHFQGTVKPICKERHSTHSADCHCDSNCKHAHFRRAKIASRHSKRLENCVQANWARTRMRELPIDVGKDVNPQ
jgi:hypothetical protein